MKLATKLYFNSFVQVWSILPSWSRKLINFSHWNINERTRNVTVNCLIKSITLEKHANGAWSKQLDSNATCWTTWTCNFQLDSRNLNRSPFSWSTFIYWTFNFQFLDQVAWSRKLIKEIASVTGALHEATYVRNFCSMSKYLFDFIFWFYFVFCFCFILLFPFCISLLVNYKIIFCKHASIESDHIEFGRALIAGCKKLEGRRERAHRCQYYLTPIWKPFWLWRIWSVSIGSLSIYSI